MSKAEIALTFNHTNRYMEAYRDQQRLIVKLEAELYQATKRRTSA